jgi:hypothetical protein
MKRIDPEAHAIHQQSQVTGLLETREIVPKHDIVAKRQIGLPGRMTIVHGLCHRTVLQIRRLSRHVDWTNGRLEASSRRALTTEGVIDQLQEQ